MRNKLPLHETPIWVLILFAPFFMISAYLLVSTVNGLKPKFLGEEIKATIIGMDSIEFNKKSSQYIIYRYYGNIKFEHKNQWLTSKYELGKGQKTGDTMALYYHRKYGFYNPLTQNLDVVFILVFSIILSALSYFYYSCFIEKFKKD